MGSLLMQPWYGSFSKKKEFCMWNDKDKTPIWEFLGWTLLLSVFTNIIIFSLEPYSILFSDEGTLTIGYVVYAIIGISISTPSPMIAVFIILKRHKKINSIKDFFKLILHTHKIKKTILITIGYCIPALGVALIYGSRTSSPFFIIFIALPVLIIGGGVEEIGWRGFLQPALENKFPFPIATIIVSVIWYVWHLPIWLLPTSNHYGDSLIGFGITIFIWSFALAAIYKSTKSVFACVMYHSFINSIGAIYDWNGLFDTFPNIIGMYIYYFILLVVSVVLWFLSDKKGKRLTKL